MPDSSISTSGTRERANELTRDSDRQIDELKTAHEKKMAAIRAQLQKEEAEARATGEAAVNHIRKTTDERTGQARLEAEAKSEREGDSISKNYQALKKRSSEQIQTSERDITASREHSDSAISSNKTREEQALQQSQAKLKDFLIKQRDLRDATERRGNDEIRDAEKRGNDVRRKAQSDASRGVREIETNHRERVQTLTQENNSTYDEVKQQGDSRLSKLKRDDEVKLQRERENGNDAFLQVHRKSHDEIEKAQKDGQVRLSAAIEDNQHKMEMTRERALSTNEKLQREYSGESQRVETEGQRDVNIRKEKLHHLVLEQKQQQKEEIANLSSSNQEKQDAVQAEGETHIQQAVSKLHDTLLKKTEQLSKQFALEDQANRNSLNNQKEIFLKQQYKQQRAQTDAFNIDESRKGDEFYRTKSFDANLVEHEDKYVLSAKVPAHEKDNVEVRVKDGKVTLSSARAFQDSVDQGDSKIETSSHQTYRQEFALAKPADSKRVLTSVRDDGSITAIIPKKGFSRS